MKLETERDVTEWVWASRALAVVSAWQALGLFERLRGGPLRREDLGADARALETTIPVLLHIGLLAGNSERIGLTPIAKRLLEEGAMPTEKNLEMFRDLGKMKEVLGSGGPVHGDDGKSKVTTGGTRDDDPAASARFLDTLYRNSGGAAQSTFDWLAPLLPERGSVLDIGGGHGRYARVFADQAFRATLYDRPHIIEYARAKHGDALAYRAGDFHTEQAFGGPYDLILLSNIVHGESPEQNASLIARAAASLNPGGYVAIKDMFLDAHGRGPENAVFFGLTMLFYTAQGRSPKMSEPASWFAAAGLSAPEVTVIDAQHLVVGRKLDRDPRRF